VFRKPVKSVAFMERVGAITGDEIDNFTS